MSDRQRPTQPVRAPSGGRYGQRQQLESAQGVIPLPNNRAQGPSPAPAPGATPGVEIPVVPDVYGQTTRPGEPATAGAALGPGPTSRGMLPDDPMMFLRAVYLQYPSSGLRRLLERSAR